MKNFFLVLLMSLSLNNQPVDEFDLIIFTTGQSSAAGIANNTYDETDTVNENVWTWDGKSWVVATPGKPPFSGANNERMNFTFYTAKKIQEQTGLKIGYIIDAKNGKEIDYWSKNVNGRVYDTNINTIEQALNGISNTRVDVILWHQGESDSMDLNKANEYGDKLNIIIDQFQHSNVTQNALFIAGSILENNYKWTYHNEINDAIWSLNFDDNPKTKSVRIDSKRYANTDNMHLSKEGDKQIAIEFSTLIMKLIESYEE